MIDTVMQDLRYAMRGILRNPGFTLTVIATLAIGIGATTAVFSFVDTILFRSLPYPDDERLVSVGVMSSLAREETTMGGFFFDWRDSQKPFSSLTFERGVSDCSLTEQSPVRLNCTNVSANFLPTLGVTPVIGRNFLPEEDLPNGAKVALISDGIWLSRFNRDPGVLNRTIQIDGKTVRIVGVLPKAFEMPRLQPVDIMMPAAVDIAAQHSVNGGFGYPMWAFARLKPGVSIPQASTELQPLFERALSMIPAGIRKDFHPVLRSLRDRQMHDVYLVAWILLGAASAVFLIAAANVASLFMARAVTRQQEWAVRSALGASKKRLIRQAMTEALLLAMLGATTGLALAEILLRIFVVIAPTGILYLERTRLDLRIILFTLFLALLCAVIFGIMPALERPRAGLLVARTTKSGSYARVRRVLVIVQISISVILLSSASMLIKSFRNLQEQNLGVQTSNVLAVRIALGHQRYEGGQAYMEFYLRAEAALRRLPGIISVGMSDSMPPDGWHTERRYAALAVVGKPLSQAGTGGTVASRIVTPDYFHALHIPILSGRGFAESDRNSRDPLMVLSSLLSSRLFGSSDPIGQHIQPELDGPVYTVVGVAGNVRNAGLTGQDAPEYYILRNNYPESWSERCVMTVESELPSTTVAPWIRSQISILDPTAPVEIDTLSQEVAKLADRPRFESALLGFFATCGLIMAVIGLYGTVSFVATRRTQEIGIRMALGASRSNILKLITREGISLIAFGGTLGFGAALIVAQLLKSLLFNVSPLDPTIFVGVELLLGIVALGATLIPARIAMKIEPVVALRYE